MSEAERNWAALGALAIRDAGLASAATGGALLLWDAESGEPGFTDAGARALLGAGRLPLATRQRLTALANGLAPRNGVRLERLRLTSGFSARLMTCACKLVETGIGAPVLAVVVPQNELRSLGVVVPTAPETPPSLPVAQIAPPEPETAAPRRALIRFLWTSDAAGRLTSLSPDFAAFAGADAAAASIGLSFAELIDRDLIDRDGGLMARFAAGATWSGHRLLWRSVTPGEGAPVELSGVPVLDAARQLAGYRGFGLARMTAPEPFALPEIASNEEPPQDAPAEAELAEAPDATVETAISADESEPTASLGAGEVVDTVASSPPEADDAPAAEAAEQTFCRAASEDALPETDLPVMTAPAEETELDEATGMSEDMPYEAEADDDESETDDEPEAPAGDAHDAPLQASESEPTKAAGVPETADTEAAAAAPVPDNIVPLRQGQLAAVRPVLEPSKPHLSSAERNAFREIAKALGARIAGEEEIGPRLPPVAPLRLKDSEPRSPLIGGADDMPAATPDSESPRADLVATDTGRPRLPNSHADVLDRLPIAVLVNRGDEALYANRTLLDLLDYADLDDLSAGGSVSRLIKEANRTDGGAMILIDRRGHLVSVDAVLSNLSWMGEPATLMAFRHPDGGGEVKVVTPEEAEEAELAAEFAAEDEESAARVEALRLDVDARESRISELVAMLDTATDGVVTVDERGRILSLNKTAEALFGYDQREVTGELFTLLFAAESHAPALDYLEGLKGGGVASVMNDGREVAGRVRQGGKIPLFMTMGQIAESPERRFCAVLRDITAWKKTEGELVEARKAAEKASAQKSDVLAKISHEIRTPLNAIIGFAEVMAEERFGPIENERYKEYLRDIHQSGGYVISLVNDLLDLAKIEAGKLDLDFVSVNLNEIALSTVALLQPEANRNRVVLRSGLSPKLPPVVADQRSIRQIVINLLSNAVKFTDAGGQVIVSTALGDQGEAILRVRDTGIGMDDKELALALEPFRQVPTTRRSGGTGLGLPLTKALVEANRAAMAITSVKKEGTLVEITFPPQRVLAG